MKNQIISHNLTSQTLVIVYSSAAGLVTKSIENSHPNWKPIIAAYKARRFDDVITLSDVRSAINAKFAGTFEVVGNNVTYKGQTVNAYLSERIIFYMREGLPCEHLKCFTENLFANPSSRAREELYSFLTDRNFTITDDGCVLGYKKVRSDFYSITGGTIKPLQGTIDAQGHILNSVGSIIAVDRGSVDDEKTKTCSFGLHVADYSYAQEFNGDNGIMLVVKFSPADAVAVPVDESARKLRVCRYEILGIADRVLSPKKDIYYGKINPTPYAEEDLDEAWSDGWTEGYEEGLEESNPIIVGTKTTGPKRNALGQFC